MTVEDFVTTYGRKIRRNKRGWLICCLYPDHQDDTPSLSIAEDGRHYCWGCHRKGTFARLLHDFAGWSWQKAIAHSDTVTEKAYTPTVLDSFTMVAAHKSSPISTHAFISTGLLGLYEVDWYEGYERYLDIEDALRKQPNVPRPAWAFPFVKGFTPDTLTRFSAGFDVDTLRVTIPVFDDVARRKLRGFLGRTCVDDPRKYLVYPGLEPSKLVYNLAVPGDFLVLVEGAWDVWMLHQKGISSAGALMTSRISEEQVELIARSGKDVIILFDNDRAGREGSMQVASALLTACRTIDIAQLPPHRVDLKQVTQEELYACIHQRKPYPAPSAWIYAGN